MDAAMETETTPTAETSPRAPGDLWLLQELVNTRDITPNTDELADVASLRAWLTARSLLDGAEAASLGPGDLARLTAFREALRAMLRANHGEPIDPEAAALVEAESERAPLRVRIDAEGGARLEPSGRGLDRVIARLLAAIAAGDSEGSWRRLKVCADDICAWAFYDVSRNVSRAWCSMAVCGNRNKARRHRRRAGSAGDQPAFSSLSRKASS
jgi:predicted RNA-binding Zn ribbon-like protein